ncbi:hypothetical protein K8I31_18410 [bacterium]|nr:hypothetical protein [bacterium]
MKVGVTSPGNIEFIKSIPSSTPTPIWVKINIDYEPNTSPKHTILSFSELVPTKKISAIIGYHIENSNQEPSIEVIYDGRPAIETDNVDLIPKWSYWSTFQIPIMVLAIGLIFTFLIGSFVVIMKNPKLKEATLLILKELNPTISNITDIILKLPKP